MATALTADAPTDPLDAFRTEARDWLAAHFPKALAHKDGGMSAVEGPHDPTPDEAAWTKAMGEKGWGVPTWPAQYGGGGLSRAEARVLQEEMSRIGAWNPIGGMGVMMFGPTLLEYGTEAQKQEHIPAIARGEVRWCQGYSEPNAGSDLAGLATSAEDAGDHYIVNGQKVWTSYADKADWIFCLVRTSKASKQGGISFVLFDMESPGVSTKPILLISGYSPFCETFMDNVKVPKANRIHEENKGWDVAKYLLGHEREMISGMGLGGQGESPLVAGAIATIGLDHDGRLADPVLRTQIALFEVRAKAFAAMSERFIDELKAGRAHPAQPSMMKYVGTELNKDRHELMMAAGGSDALEWESERSSTGAAPRAWLRTKANSIEGGTSEIQLNIIAKRILELPGA